MQVAATLRYARISPQKCRLVADAIRGKTVDDALRTLTFTPKKGARIVKKVLESAIANAEHNHGADIDELKVKVVMVDEAPSFKRWQARGTLHVEPKRLMLEAEIAWRRGATTRALELFEREETEATIQQRVVRIFDKAKEKRAFRLLVDNLSDNRGGAVDVGDGELSVVRGEATGNQAAFGGAYYLDGGALTRE